MKKTIAKINETKSWFFKKINTIHKLIKKKVRGLIFIKLEMKKREATTDTAEIPRIVRDYYKQPYAPNMDKLSER